MGTHLFLSRRGLAARRFDKKRAWDEPRKKHDRPPKITAPLRGAGMKIAPLRSEIRVD